MNNKKKLSSVFSEYIFVVYVTNRRNFNPKHIEKSMQICKNVREWWKCAYNSVKQPQKSTNFFEKNSRGRIIENPFSFVCGKFSYFPCQLISDVSRFRTQKVSPSFRCSHKIPSRLLCVTHEMIRTDLMSVSVNMSALGKLRTCN